MTVYLLFYAFLAYCLFFLSIRYNKTADVAIGLMSTFIFILVSGFRTSGGTDLPAYLQLWSYIQPGTSDTYTYNFDYFEPGFRYILGLFKLIGESDQVYLFGVSILIHITLYIGMLRNNISTTWGSLVYLNVYFISYSLNAVQQAIVMSISVVLISFINNKSFGVGYISSFVTILLHKSMAMFLVVSYFLRKRYPKYLIYIALVIALILYGSGLPSLVVNNLDFLTGFNDFDKVISIVNILQKLVIISLCIYFFRYSRQRSFDKIILLGVIFGFLLYIVFLDFAVLATRIVMFFRIFEFVLIGRLFKSVPKGKLRLFFTFSTLAIYFPSFMLQIAHEDSVLNF